MNFRTRDDLPSIVEPKFHIGVEVGVQRGDFARVLLRGWSGRLLLVDPWRQLEGYRDDANVSDAEHEKIMQQAIAACERTGHGRFEIMRMTSLEAAVRLATDGTQVDFVYIDADHSYDAVKADIAAWRVIVRDGGVIAGHDWVPDGEYTYGSFGVQRAVKEAFPNTQIIISQETNGIAPSWMVTK